jgi:hypothetical protein
LKLGHHGGLDCVSVHDMILLQPLVVIFFESVILRVLWCDHVHMAI